MLSNNSSYVIISMFRLSLLSLSKQSDLMSKTVFLLCGNSSFRLPIISTAFGSKIRFIFASIIFLFSSIMVLSEEISDL